VVSRILIALNSLRAEGTPVLALEMSRRWLEQGIVPAVVCLAEKPSDLRAEFQALGVSVHSLDLPDRGKLRYLRMTSGISRICRQLRPHAFLSMPLGWHAFMAAGAKSAGVRRVAAHVGNYPTLDVGLAFEKFRVLVQLGRVATDKLICCSEYVKNGVHEVFRVPADQLEVIYNGCRAEDVARRADAARKKRSDRRFRIGMVARLEIHKDQPTLIRAAGLLVGRGHDLVVDLVGEGSRRKEYEEMIATLGLVDRVRLLGMRRDVPELLGGLDAFVFAAKPDEGFGVALAEAMAAGIPVIATDVGACREVLDGGRLGTLVPPGQPESLAAAIEQLLLRRGDSESRVAESRARAFSAFTIDAMADAYARCLHIAS
jgi:glycosyltransferase involved in cell wall biosynthesis